MQSIPGALNIPEANFIVGLRTDIHAKLAASGQDLVDVELQFGSLKKESLKKYALVFELSEENRTFKNYRYLYFGKQGSFCYSFGNTDSLERGLKLFDSEAEIRSAVTPILKSQPQIKAGIKRTFMCKLSIENCETDPCVLLTEKKQIRI